MLALEKLCARLERQQERVLRELAAWPMDLRTFQPAAETWSAAQVLDHVTKNERCVAEDVWSRLQPESVTVSSEDAEKTQRLIRWLLSEERASLTREESGVSWPDDAPDWDATVAEWRAVREKLLATARSCEHQQPVFRHSFTGAMDMAVTLRYLYAHTRHHEHQLARLREAASSLRT